MLPSRRTHFGPLPLSRQCRTAETLTLRYSATSISVNCCFLGGGLVAGDWLTMSEICQDMANGC